MGDRFTDYWILGWKCRANYTKLYQLECTILHASQTWCDHVEANFPSVPQQIIWRVAFRKLLFLEPAMNCTRAAHLSPCKRSQMFASIGYGYKNVKWNCFPFNFFYFCIATLHMQHSWFCWHALCCQLNKYSGSLNRCKSQ